MSERLLSQDSTAEIRGTEMCGAGNSRLRRPEAPAHFGKGNHDFPSSDPIREEPSLIRQRHHPVRSQQIQSSSTLFIVKMSGNGNGERSQAENLTLNTDIPTLTRVRHLYSVPLVPRFQLFQGSMTDGTLTCSIFCRNNRSWDTLLVAT